MRIDFHQLAQVLEKTLPPVCLICGDEPLQSLEAAQQVRAAAHRRGFTEREVLEHGPSFDWSLLAGTANALSLFADKRLIELRLASSKIGTPGSKALVDYCTRISPDTLVLVTAPKLERTQLASKWVKAIDHAGVLLQVWPVSSAQLPGWLARRMRSRGLRPEPGVSALLAERVEGNLLAGAQEIEKLVLRYGANPIDSQQLLAGIGDSARYDVFDLSDAALRGQLDRVLRILTGLQAQATPLPVILWALAREIRALADMAFELRQGKSLPQLLAAHRVWEKRKPLVRAGLERHALERLQHFLACCATIDQQIKGQALGDPWEGVRLLVAELAGAAAMVPSPRLGEAARPA